jgi:Protein of unknown function (DUF4240)
VKHVTLDEFWNHIRATRRKDPDAHVERLVARLAKLSPDEILNFDRWWDLMHGEAYHRKLWAAAYLINGGCSDDGFMDFRSWLILQGRDVFQAAVANPDTLADVLDGDEASCECYPASDAWFQATGLERDDAGYAAKEAAYQARHPDRPAQPELDPGEDWDFDDDEEMRHRLPRLAKMYLESDD